MKPALFLTAALGALCLGGAAQAASMHTLVFTGSGTFTIPATATPATEFEFTVVAGGGGGGGCSSTSYAAPGGGSGGAGLTSFSGFAASQAVTITVGVGGTGGAASGGADGISGGGSRVKAAGVNIVTTTGGKGSNGQSNASITGGAAGTFTAAAGASGLTLASSLDYAPQDGMSYHYVPASPIYFYQVAGGGNPIGHPGTLTDYDGVLGGGALGCQNLVQAGGTGGAGVVIVRWAL
jgi:hypothetical protein